MQTNKQRQSVEKYRKTVKGWMNASYQAMKSNAKSRRLSQPNFTRKEFDAYVKNQPHFFMLFDIWKESEFEKWKRPSVDRIDHNKGYTFNNIRIVSWKENHRAGCNSEFNKAVTRWRKSKFKKDDIIFIREAVKRGLQSRHLAELYGVADSTICMIVNRKNWGDIDA